FDTAVGARSRSTADHPRRTGSRDEGLHAMITATTIRPSAAPDTAAEASPRGGTAAQLREQWAGDPRWAGIARSYDADDVIALRPSVVEEHTLARRGATRLWELLHQRPF